MTTQKVSLSLKPETVCEIDKRRGLAKRSTFAQFLLEKVLQKE